MKIKYTSNKSSRWSIKDDRLLCYDGAPVLFIASGYSRLSVEDGDDLAEFIAFLLNEEQATPERGEIITITRREP